jgi:hypothetical protein
MMVQVIKGTRPLGDHWWEHAQSAPEVHVHFVERSVFGNGIGIRVYGEMKIAAGEIVYAREMKLNCLQVLLLTPEVSRTTGGRADHGYMAHKWIYHKSEYGNWASIDVYLDDGTWQGPGTGPTGGSIWLDFEALGE